MLPAANKHGMPLGMLYAVGLTETGRGDSLQPYALNIEGRAVYDLDRRAALDRFRVAQQAGARSIDVGCMQVNLRYHPTAFRTLEASMTLLNSIAGAQIVPFGEGEQCCGFGGTFSVSFPHISSAGQLRPMTAQANRCRTPQLERYSWPPPRPRSSGSRRYLCLPC